MLTYLITAAIVIAALGMFIAARPASFRVQRTVRIKAPPEAIYPLIADFHRWLAWSPFEGLDPELKREYGGAESGLGAVYGWSGNSRAGAGRMVITDVEVARKVLIKLDFLKPFEAHNTAEFTLVPVDGGTEVTWAMYGPNSFMSKAMHLVMNMDKMIGGMFADGLAKMKAAAEGG